MRCSLVPEKVQNLFHRCSPCYPYSHNSKLNVTPNTPTVRHIGSMFSFFHISCYFTLCQGDLRDGEQFQNDDLCDGAHLRKKTPSVTLSYERSSLTSIDLLIILHQISCMTTFKANKPTCYRMVLPKILHNQFLGGR